MSEQDQADPKVVGDDNAIEPMPNLDSEIDTPIAETEWRLAEIDKELTPLQYHYLSLLQRLVALQGRSVALEAAVAASGSGAGA